jgi:polyphosphate glucokinase
MKDEQLNDEAPISNGHATEASTNGKAPSPGGKSVLVLDVGGTHVKMLVSGESTPRKIETGFDFTPQQLVDGVTNTTGDWQYDGISIGVPGPVLGGRIAANPPNLGCGWVGFDFEAAFKKPVKIINDAAMQALGSYEGGKMLFLGLGTGLGSAMIVEGNIEPMELGHMPYRKRTFEDYVGLRGLERVGKKKWRRFVFDVVDVFQKALEPDYIVLGGGNSMKLKKLPPNCRLGSNEFAFTGGFRLWEPTGPGASGKHQEMSRAMAAGDVNEGAHQ